MSTIVFWFLLNRELERRCAHGHWDPEMGGWCMYCDTGMST